MTIPWKATKDKYKSFAGTSRDGEPQHFYFYTFKIFGLLLRIGTQSRYRLGWGDISFDITFDYNI